MSGLYYFKEMAHEEQPVNIALELFHGAANFDPRMDVLNRNYAAFGQADVSLTDKLKLTAGGRLGDDMAPASRVSFFHVENESHGRPLRRWRHRRPPR